MHTATRLALPVLERVRRVNASARVAAYGLYAPLSEDVLHSAVAEQRLAEGDRISLGGYVVAVRLTEPKG